jgi:site-specific recombinase XerD
VSELCWLELGGIPKKEGDAGELIVRGRADGKEKWTRKSHNQRHVPLSRESMVPLKKHHLSQPPGTGWVLPGWAGRRLVGPSKGLRAVFRRAGIYKRDCLLQILRHTAATEWLAGGADLATVKDLLGHVDISTTQIYFHATETRKREAVERAGLSFPLESVKVSVKVVTLA